MKVDKIIYTLSHPVTGLIVYVGITQYLEGRVRSHYNSPKPELKAFMDDLKAKSLYPIITEVARGGHDLEAVYIRQYKEAGHPLVNKNSISWTKLAVRRIDEPVGDPVPKSVYVEDDIYNKWMSKYSRQDIRNIAGMIKKSKEYVRICLVSREMPTAMYEAAKTYYEPIPVFIPPTPVLKECGYCKIEKDLSEYKQYKSPFCRACCNTYPSEIKAIKSKDWRIRTNSVSQKKWNEKNKDKIKKYMSEYRKTWVHPDPERRKAALNSRAKKRTEDLHPSYVKELLKREKSPIDPKIIELKTKSLEIKRQLQEARNAQ